MFGIELHPGWLWAIAGTLLLIAEVLAPGVFLMFIGAAAIVTGVVTLATGIPLTGQLLLFVIASALTVRLGRRYYAEPPQMGELGMINNPSRRLEGKSATVIDPVDDHGGRVKLGDSEWSARGGPAAAGQRVRITGVDGNCLIVAASEDRAPPAIGSTPL